MTSKLLMLKIMSFTKELKMVISMLSSQENLLHLWDQLKREMHNRDTDTTLKNMLRYSKSGIPQEL